MMKYLYMKLLLGTVLVGFLFSCTSYKELAYIKDVDTLDPTLLAQTKGVHEPKIMPNDILSITVNSEIKGAAEDFNLPLVAPQNSQAVQTQISTTNSSLQNYIVDKEGKINFPVLGELKIGGMTIEEARNYIADEISPKYIATRPIVNVRYLNFEVAVLGEVKNPGKFRADNGQMTILDALAAAGDMTIYGKRDNVLLVRTKEDGELAFHKIDLRDKNIVMNKELFYLQQNDKLYVNVNKARGNSSLFGSMESIGLSALSVVISVVAIVTR